MLKSVFTLIVFFLTSACNGNLVEVELAGRAEMRKKAELTEKDFILQSEALKKAIVKTPYSALIKVTSVDIFDMPDSDKSDDYAEQKLTYHAKVIESYRGKADRNITYVMYIEKGEDVGHPKEAFIITLCQSRNGLFWPGVGASFSSDYRLRELARKHSKQFSNQQSSFEDCE